MVCPQEGRGVEPVWTYCGRGGLIFLRFWADVFYGRPLTSFPVVETGGSKVTLLSSGGFDLVNY